MPKLTFTKNKVKYKEFKVIQSLYCPSVYDYEAGAKDLPLIIIAECVDRNIQPFTFYIRDSLPRFWVKENPYDRITADVMSECVEKIEYSGKTIYLEPLWCIYTRYPFQVSFLRKFFTWHGQADIVYRQAWKIFYNIKDTFKVDITKIHKIKENTYNVSINDLIPTNGDYFETRDYLIDIEYVKYITRVTVLERQTGEIYHFSTRNVDVEEIKKNLSNKEWLLKHLNLRKPERCLKWLMGEQDQAEVEIPKDLEVVNPDKIHVYCAREPNEGECEPSLIESFKERQLIVWFNNLKEEKHFQIVMAHYADSDTKQLEGVPQRRNQQIREWNFENPNKIHRKYYPRISFENCQVFCTMKGYEHLHEGRVTVQGRRALDWIGLKELGYGKIKLDRSHEWTEKNDPSFYSAYNIWDCVLPDRIDKAIECLKFHKNLCSFAGASLEYCTAHMMLAETYLMFELSKEQRIMPSIACIEQFDLEKFEGGYVSEPFFGIGVDILLFDITASYPAEIISQGIDPEMLVSNLCNVCYNNSKCGCNKKSFDKCEFLPKIKVSINPNGTVFSLEKEGILPRILKGLLNHRNELKKKEKEAKEAENKFLEHVYFDQQRVVKFFMNSFFGVFGTDDDEDAKTRGRPFRLKSKLIASNITIGAKYHIKWTRDFIKKYKMLYKIYELMFDVLYIDTDSCFVVIKDRQKYELSIDDLNKIANLLVIEINKSYDQFAKETFGIDKHYFQIKFEDIYLKFAQWGKKKHYAYINGRGELKFKGIKTRRSDSSKLQRCTFEAFFKQLLESMKSLKELSKFINIVEKNIRKGLLDDGLPKPIGIKSEGNHYKKAMDYSNKYLGKEFEMGDKVFIWLIEKMKPKYPKPPKIGGYHAIALDWGDNPYEFVEKLSYEGVINKHIDTEALSNVLQIFPELRGENSYKKFKDIAVVPRLETYLK